MLFIAEIGLNYNGNFDTACELIEKAKSAGADIAKFQLGWKGKEGEINHITEESLNRLGSQCRRVGIEFMVSVFTRNAYTMAKRYGFKRYKIASRTVIGEPELVKDIISEGKEVFISLGMWDQKGFPFPEQPNIKYLWCRSKYPCQIQDLAGFPKDFAKSGYAGYSDHTIGIDTVLLAVARGAGVIEKHITLCKTDTAIRDHALSATPEEFKIMVDIARGMRQKLEAGI